jgi:cytosine/uracil/thiamine/allantoin permease
MTRSSLPCHRTGVPRAYNHASLWVAMSVCTPTDMVASGLIAGGHELEAGLITGIVGVLMMPWKLLTDIQSYIFGWLIGYSAPPPLAD